MIKAFSVSTLLIIVFSCVYHNAISYFPTQVLAQKDNTNTFLTYNNPTFGIKIQYPSDWKVEENKDHSEDNTDVVTFSSPVSEEVAISVDNINDNSMTLMQYVNDTVLSDLNQSRDFTMLQSNSNAILDGNPAYSVTYTDKDPEPFKGMEIVTLKNGRAYDISYSADLDTYDSVLPTVQTMINSFSTTPSSS